MQFEIQFAKEYVTVCLANIQNTYFLTGEKAQQLTALAALEKIQVWSPIHPPGGSQPYI